MPEPMSLWDPFVSGLVAGLILIVPLWRIFSRAGLPPLLALLVFLPFVGTFAVLVVLALSRWPAFERVPR